MTFTVSITEDQIFSVLGQFLQSVVPSTCAVVRGQVNRVPEPQGTDFVVMWPTLRERLSTNVDTYDDQSQNKNLMQPTKITVQCDVHGPCSADNAQIISTMFRDAYATDFFTSVFGSVDLQPLYSDDPRQTPFMNAEQQYEERWIVQMVMQANPVVVIPQQSALTVNVEIISVDQTYKA